MKKTRLLSVIAALLVTFSVMGASTMQVKAEGCGNWYVYYTGTPYCKNEGCGFLWLNPQTNYQSLYYKRTCVSNDNKVTTDYKHSVEKIGCC